jgi:hypothetical protein
LQYQVDGSERIPTYETEFIILYTANTEHTFAQAVVTGLSLRSLPALSEWRVDIERSMV